VSSFTIDTTPPTLAETTVVPSLTNDNTTQYTFSSTEGGTITVGGNCSNSSDNNTAVADNMTVSFAALADGTYSNCTITVTDSAGNSVTRNVNSFTIDTTAPTLAEVTAVPPLTNDNASSYTFSTDQTGTIAYAGGCSSTTTSATATNNEPTNNTIRFNAMADGDYINCKISVTDNASNTSDNLTVSSFTIDTVKPVLAEVTAVTTPTDNTTPAYSFSSTEAGTNSYGGSCGSSSTSATSSGLDNVTIILTQSDNSTALSEAQYADCSITVTDPAGNPSIALIVNTFIVDTTAPTVASTSPTDNLTSSVSVSDNISVTFSESMDNTSVTTNTSNTTCSGYSFQVSSDNFSTCVQMGSLPTVSNSNQTFTVTPSLKMFYSATYKIRVTNAAKDSAGNNIASQYTHTDGFKTTITIPMTAGFAYSCFMLDNGSVKCWGKNNLGQLGLGDTINRGDNSSKMGDNLTIVDLGSGRTATAIATGDSHTCAILDNESIKCWGANASGQLGLGDTDNRGDNSSKMGDNLTIVDLGTGRTARAISAGDRHTCAILDDASLKCWGENGNGQLGLGAGISNRGDGSGEMGDNLTAINLGSGRTATSITTGTGYTCVLLDDDSVKCWGRADYGQLGAGKTEEYNEPNASPIDLGTGITATAIASGYFHTCAILDNSSIKCWGRNDSGQLGIGDTGNRGDGTNEFGLTEMGDNLPAVDLGAGRTARAISAGDRHTCVVLDNTSLKCWGKNESGQLGLGDNSPRGDNSSGMGDNLPVISL
jgi:alpha-tubulin suppressor-like RCC1 family protein